LFGRGYPLKWGVLILYIEENINQIEACQNLGDLDEVLQNIINNYGFSSFCFVDIGKQHQEIFHYSGTTGQAWESDYVSNGFFHVDEVIKLARRINTPFNWGSVPLPKRLGKRKPAALKVFEAAQDYKYTEGLVVPLHFVDDIGRMHSSICSLFWQDQLKDFNSVTSDLYKEIHLILIYWIQRSIEIRGRVESSANIYNLKEARNHALGVNLTDREREVIVWAARGKTVNDTGAILSLSPETIDDYVRSAIRKLSAGNKTHAVAKAIHLGLIDI